MKDSVIKITYPGIYIAFCVVIGYIFLTIPNIELLTLFVFFGGFLFGKIKGAFIGGISMFFFSAMNPWGSGLAFPPLIISQVVSYYFIGLAGGLVKSLVYESMNRIIKSIIFGFCGLILTAFYHVLVSFFTAEIAGFDYQKMGIIIIGGLGFAMVQIIFNTVMFALLIPALIPVSKRISAFQTR
ncbi:MAG: hypothetical protein GY863_21885 [bacterium]|nr:hypothetical protein [bacterium]